MMDPLYLMLALPALVLGMVTSMMAKDTFC